MMAQIVKTRGVHLGDTVDVNWLEDIENRILRGWAYNQERQRSAEIEFGPYLQREVTNRIEVCFVDSEYRYKAARSSFS